MTRLNTSIPASPRGAQNNLGVLGGDKAGFPNGRRPGDDVTDIELRVAMGVLCHAFPGNYCNPADAPSGNLPYTDQVLQDASQFDSHLPLSEAGHPRLAERPQRSEGSAPVRKLSSAVLACRRAVPAARRSAFQKTFSGEIMNDAASRIIGPCMAPLGGLRSVVSGAAGAQLLDRALDVHAGAWASG